MSINDIMELARLKGRVIALEAELESEKAAMKALRASSFVTAVPSEDYEKLKAEVERLRKAVDAVQKRLIFLHDRWDSDEPNIESDAWNAAKEGKPSV